MREKPRRYSGYGCRRLRVSGVSGLRGRAAPWPAFVPGGGFVLSIGKIGKSEQQQAYYEETVAKSREDYYAGTGEAPGEFFGRGSAALGLSGESNMEQLKRLFAGQNPATGEQLRSMKGNVQVHGLDMTFSAPKSVSIAYALGDDDLQANVVAAHEWAVGQAVDYMERETARVVRGHKATRAERAAGIEDTLTTHRAGGFVGIRYRHRLNRLQDPQLHTHFVVGNWALGPDGRYTALAAEHIYEHAKSGGAVYQLALRSKLRELEPWVEWGEVENAMAEFSPELMDPDMLKAFSMRSHDIEEFMANPYKFIGNQQLAREAELAMAGMSARGRRQYATLRTRQSKLAAPIDEQGWRMDAVARAAEWNFGTDTLAAYREMPAYEATEAFDVAGVQARAFGPMGVTANQNTFERKDIVIEVANNSRNGVGSWLSDIDAVVGEVMDSSQVLHVRTDKLRERLTTVELVGQEQHLIETAVEGLAVDRAVVDAAAIDEGLARYYATNAKGVEQLLPGQERVLRGVVSDGNAISSIEALAGSGKTTTAGAMREVFEAGGYNAFAAGPTGRAVRELADAEFVRPRTLSAWEVKFEVMGAPEAIRQGFGDPSRAVLFIDETGMADTRLLSKVATQMSDAGVKVVLIGDSYQLTSVRAGGMHAALSGQLGAYELTTVTRQNLAEEVDALEALRDGKPDAYLGYKLGRAERDESGRVARWTVSGDQMLRGDETFAGRNDMEIFTGEEANQEGMAQAVADYLQMRERTLDLQAEKALAGGDVSHFEHARGMNDIALITRDNARRALLNDMIRERLTEQGVLTGHMTMGSHAGEKLEWAVGDRVIARRNHKGYDLDNGTLGTIVELDATGMTLSDDNGNERRFDADNVEHLKYVSENLEHAYALTAHGTQGATLRWAGVVGLPGEFSREWAYTALSRAKELTKVYLVSAHTQGEEERKDYATVMDAEIDHDKIVGRMASRMEKRDLDQVALLQRARDGHLNIGANDQLDQDADAEFVADVERYRDAKYRLASDSLLRMQGAPEVRGDKLQAYADVLAYRATVEQTNSSEQMQDAIQAAEEWQRFGETIETVYANAGEHGLTAEQRQTVETLTGVREQIVAEYLDPQTILNIEARRQATLVTLEREVRVTRAAAIGEHLAAKPEWLTMVGTQPAGRTLRETWGEVVDDLAGRYVDAVAFREVERMRAESLEAIAEPVTVDTAASDAVADARTAAKRAYDALAADPTNRELLGAAVDAQGVAERVEVASEPQWLTATLGERPVDPSLAEQWDAIGRRMIGVRDANNITSEIDNGYVHAGKPLREAIERFRVQVGLDQARGLGGDQGFGLGD